jgi:hypothetical protein
MYVVVSLEYLEKFILPIDEKSGRYISERKKGEFSAQIIPTLGGQQHLKAVTTFKNGKIIGTEETAQASPDEASTFKVSDKEKVNAPPFP